MSIFSTFSSASPLSDRKVPILPTQTHAHGLLFVLVAVHRYILQKLNRTFQKNFSSSVSRITPALYNIYSSLPTIAPNVLHWIWVPLFLTNQTIPNVLALNLNLSIALDGTIKMGWKHENCLIQSIPVPILASSLTGMLSLLVFASRLCFQTSTFQEKKKKKTFKQELGPVSR